uniref:Movement protein TGBp3 n=1 Tax=Dioscorea potexvirus 1 TaxID=2794413 RepID=A0A7T5QZ70_9VIRU|nr:TGB3 [Dioscorea potexvirus 1]
MATLTNKLGSSFPLPLQSFFLYLLLPISLGLALAYAIFVVLTPSPSLCLLRVDGASVTVQGCKLSEPLILAIGKLKPYRG